MTFYTRKQLVEMLETDEGFLLALEREEIIASDAPSGVAGEFSERMLERARFAHNLVADLDVNLAGAAIIVRLREEMAELRRQITDVLGELERRERGGG
jgi:MerR family transcriptional regulator/heat shock protein HspR